jgi:hypothetical protein
VKDRVKAFVKMVINGVEKEAAVLATGLIV